MTRHRVLAAGVIAALAASAASAAPAQVALLICNDDYDRDRRLQPDPPLGSPFLPDLLGPCADADRVAAGLSGLDFRITRASNLDRAGLAATLARFGTETAALAPGSTIFVYYAGHGVQFAGEVYGVPVLYRNPGGTAGLSLTDKRKFLLTNANLWAGLLNSLPNRPDLAVAVVVDACRNNPFAEATVYNEANVPRGPNNQFVYWATNGGNTATDEGLLAGVIADAFRRGGTISEVMARVWRRHGELFDAGKLTAEGEPWTGRDFRFQRQPVLRRAVAAPPPLPAPPPRPVSPPRPPAPSTGAAGTDRATQLRQIAAARPPHAPVLKRVTAGRGPALNIFVCEGEGEVARLAFAEAMADSMATGQVRLALGEIRVRYLTEPLNAQPGYRVRINMVRYDVASFRGAPPTAALIRHSEAERRAAVALARAFPAGDFLPSPGIGVGGNPTASISAFLCGRVPDA